MTKDLTVGKISPILIKFTIPLVLGNLFQLTYNAVDSIIVGRYVGKEALAAVGTCNPLMTLAILFMNGMCMGAGILMGNQYGSKDYNKLKRQISTTMLAGFAFSLIISLLSIIFAQPILKLIQVPPEILSLSVGYLRIIFFGLIFTFLYNFYASTLRALGDSSTPLYFLIISSVLNIIGDLFFVMVCNWGSNGCALSTVISEILCCILCNIYISKKVPLLNLGRQWFVFDRTLLKTTISYGWASAMQQATVQLGKIGIQSIVNTMGVTVTAAFAAVNRIDDFAYTPQQNIGHAMTAFMAQNRGAKKNDRVKKSFGCGIRLEMIYSAFVFALCFFLAKPLMLLFVRDPEVINEGVSYLKLIAIMYFLPGLTNGVQGYFRGIGDLKITLVSSFVNFGVRVAACFVFVILLHIDIRALPLSYLAGWIGMLIAELPLLFRSYRLLGSK